MREILEELTFSKLEDWRKTPIQESINQVLQDLYEIIEERMPEEGEHWKEHYMGDKKFAQGYNLCLSEVHKVLKEVFEQ